MARLSQQAKPWSSHSAQRVGLAQKAGLVALTGDDRAVLYGAVLTLAMRLQGEDREHTLALWRRGGKRAFETDDKTGR